MTKSSSADDVKLMSSYQSLRTTLLGKQYRRGARLTVDKNKNWVEVSSWQ